MTKTVAGLMENMQQAQALVQDLLNVGIDRSAINIIGGQHAESAGKFEDLKQNERAEGAATGAGAGAAVGGLAGFVAGLTALTIPGIGPVLALGPLGAALAGAGVGAAAGGGVGALIKMGVPERDAHYYSEGIKRGGVLVTVNAPDDRVSEVANLMQKDGAIDIDKRAQTWRKEGWTGLGTQRTAEPMEQREGYLSGREDIPYQGREDVESSREHVPHEGRQGMAPEERESFLNKSPGRLGERIEQREGMTPEERETFLAQSQGRMTAGPEQRETLTRRGMEDTSRTGMLGEGERILPVIEEDVQVGKREVSGGVVRVYSRVLEVPVEEQVNLREEHATIERRPADRPVAQGEAGAFQESTVEIRESREEPVVSKQARVKEEVVVGKEASEHVETIHETARQTSVDVERSDDATRRGLGATGLAAEDEEYRRHYQNTYGGKDFEAYRSAYHYADEDSDARRFQDRDFSEIEEDVHRSWDKSHPGTWTQFKDAIRYGWNRKRHH